MYRAVFLATSILAALLGTGCHESCESACRKLIDTCQVGIASYNVRQCSADCAAIEESYEAYEYLEPQLEAFHAQLDCIRDAECTELQNPDPETGCYADAQQLYVF